MIAQAIMICAALVMHDADSGRCDGVPVRLAGIDAGETAPFTRCRQRPDVWACSPRARAVATASTARARQLTSAGARCVDTGARSYRRVVARCTVSGGDLGAILVREGLARSDPDFGDQYAAEEAYARIRRRGVWR